MGDLELPDELRDSLRGAWHRYLDQVEPLRPALHRYCRRLTGDLWDAEDLLQDTLLRAFGVLGRLHDPVRNPRAYLLRTATNLWIDGFRRRQREAALLSDAAAAPTASAAPSESLRDAGLALLSLAPRERAAVLLKDVFDLDLEESAEVLETSVGAVKAALHRGRERLRNAADAAREESGMRRRTAPPVAVVDRFVALFNAGDKAGLLALVLDNATVENVGIGAEWGYEGHRSPKSWFDGALGGHPEWPAEWRYESQRAARAVLEGEAVALLFRTRGGREKLEAVLRFEEEDGQVAHMRSYGFCPETVRAVGEALGFAVRSGPYRYPTPEPGRSYEPAPEPRGGTR
jgi:RNA polymerase sigma-70 factor (ECF subfamily)